MGPDVIPADSLVTVAKGMAKVQQAARAVVLRITGYQVQLGPSAGGNKGRQGRAAIAPQALFGGGQQCLVSHQAGLDDLRHAGGKLPLRQRRQAGRVRQHQRRLVERTQQVFAFRQVQSRLAAQGAVHLGKQRGGDMGQRHAPQQRRGGKARRVAAGAATQRHHAAGTVKTAVQYPAAQGHPGLRRFGTLTLGQQEQPHLQSGSPEAALYPLAIKGRCIFIRRQRPAAHLRHVLPQQRAGAPQHTGADTHRAGRVVQLDGELFHRLPPQPAGHCIQQSDSRLAIKSLSIDGNINT